MGGSPGFILIMHLIRKRIKGNTWGQRINIKTLFLKMLHEEHVDILLNTLLDALVEEKNYRWQ